VNLNEFEISSLETFLSNLRLTSIVLGMKEQAKK
jgi:hypothetical protein